MARLSIGVIGDLHTHWDAVDVAHFNRSAYDLLLFTGDLGGGTADSSLRIAKSMAGLRKQTLVMPGNNDTGDIHELGAELGHRGGMRSLHAVRRGLDGGGHGAAVRLCGYSTHRLTAGPVDVTLIAGRPHSMGGADLSFPDHMLETYDVASIAASTERLLRLVDAVETRDVVFLSHNGPKGLGEEPHDIWGCDFKPGGGDWGDPDLTMAIEHALARGKRVLAVVAGHMHLRTKSGVERAWRVERNGIIYVNAARVPRIVAADSRVTRHHVALALTPEGIEVGEVLVPEVEN